MPYKPLSPCKHTGCNRVCEGNYCEIHKRLHNRDTTRPSAAKRGYNTRWQRQSQQYLREHPFCVRCGGIAEVVDHIQPHKGNQQLFWSYSNWQSLCKQCHDKKTVKEDGGFGFKIKEK